MKEENIILTLDLDQNTEDLTLDLEAEAILDQERATQNLLKKIQKKVFQDQDLDQFLVNPKETTEEAIIQIIL